MDSALCGVTQPISARARMVYKLPGASPWVSLPGQGCLPLGPGRGGGVVPSPVLSWGQPSYLAEVVLSRRSFLPVLRKLFRNQEGGTFLHSANIYRVPLVFLALFSILAMC